jgi:AbrB family looped-hinge helix DNA binding protein
MREVTMTLKIDRIGRVGIPKVIRDEYGIQAGDLVELRLVVEDAGKNH